MSPSPSAPLNSKHILESIQRWIFQLQLIGLPRNSRRMEAPEMAKETQISSRTTADLWGDYNLGEWQEYIHKNWSKIKDKALYLQGKLQNKKYSLSIFVIIKEQRMPAPRLLLLPNGHLWPGRTANIHHWLLKPWTSLIYPPSQQHMPRGTHWAFPSPQTASSPKSQHSHIPISDMRLGMSR